MKEVRLIVTLEFSDEIDQNLGTAEVAQNVMSALEHAVNTIGIAPEHTEKLFSDVDAGCYTTSISIISESDDSFELVREF